MASQEQRLLDALAKDDFVYFDNKHALGRWSTTLHDMEQRGLITTTFVDMPEQQYSRLEVRRVR